MRKTSKEFLDWLGLKEKDRVKVDDKIYVIGYDGENFMLIYNDGHTKNIWWLLDSSYEVIPPILSDKERKELKKLIEPYKYDIKYIGKTRNNEYEDITIILKDFSHCVLEHFIFGTNYNNMIINQSYTLKELDLL